MSFERNTKETSAKSAVDLEGGFATNGASAPTAAQIYGNFIASVARDGAGAYSVTLKPEFRNMDLISKQCSLQLAAAGDSHVQFGPYDKTTGVLVVRTLTGTAAADIAASADNIVWLKLCARWGSAEDGSVIYDA